MVKVDCIVYSKDRACQLDLLLRTTKEMFDNVGRVYVIYMTTQHAYDMEYERIKYNAEKYGLDLVFITQGNFDQQFRDVIKGMSTPYFLGLCDDDVVIKKTDVSEIVEKLYEQDVSAISIKAGKNIKFNYPKILAQQPEFIEEDPFLKWEWRKSRCDIDWGYPTCNNAFIYLRDYYLQLVEGLYCPIPPMIEANLNTVRQRFKPLMVSFKETRILNTPVNCVQSISPNPHGKEHEYSIEDLNTLFMSNMRISTRNIYGRVPEQANDEVPFIFEQAT